MKMEAKQPIDIMNTPEMQAYLSARQSVQEDEALTELLSSYKESVARLISMIQEGSFDSQAVVALSDDTDRMKSELERNEKLLALEAARMKAEALLESGEAVYTASCSGNCATCHGCGISANRKKED